MAKPKQTNSKPSKRAASSDRSQAAHSASTPQSPSAHRDQIETLLEHLEEMESRISQLHQGLAHSHRLTTLGTITSIIAHEFNNLLTPIMSYSQLAIKNPDDLALSQKANAKSFEAASRAAHIAESMLDFARQEDSENHISSLYSVLDQVMGCIAREPEKDNIEFKRPSADQDVRILINPTHLHQVLINLILNARKALLPRGGMIQINGQLIGTNVILEITDNGPGIPTEILGSLFEPFVTQPTNQPTNQPTSKPANQRNIPPVPADHGSGAMEDVRLGAQMDDEDDRRGASACAALSGNALDDNELNQFGPVNGESNTSAQGQGERVDDEDKLRRGTGLGLYICRQLIERAGGDIAVTSEPGHGATFTIRLPRATDLD